MAVQHGIGSHRHDIVDLWFGIKKVEHRGRGKTAIKTHANTRLGKRCSHQADQAPQHAHSARGGAHVARTQYSRA